MKTKSKVVKSTDLFEFYELWKKLYIKYRDITHDDSKHISFPEPLSRMLAKKIDSTLVDAIKPYDFQGNIEMKSVTLPLSSNPKPNSHFSHKQNDCKRLLFFVITPESIDYYNITNKNLLSKINAKVAESPDTGANIALSDYIGKTNPIRITIEKEE